MEAATHSIRLELEETIKHWVKDVPSCVEQKMQGLRKELTEKIDETQVDLQTVKTSIDTWTRSLKGNIMDTNKDFHEDIVNARNNLHEELGLMFQVDTQTTKAEIRIDQERMEANIEVTLSECGRRTGTSTCTKKPPKFAGTTSWATFKTAAQHNCWMSQEKYIYLINALQGWATEVLHKVPKGATYKQHLRS
jgi:hypothetical protein